MDPVDTVFALKIAAMVTIAVLIVVIVVARSGACAGARRAVVHDVERALGAATLMPYAQAAAVKMGKAEAAEEARQCCALCLSDYAGGNELVRVVPACGHFFHADCDIDRWLRAHRTCPLCRGGLWPLPTPPCPPMPPRALR
ncbi:hypothetical protein QOZ80_3BG0268880 [Eleusine coracana subsp. coracana]|nr:hypothetical protein QOZ80_3BG0268880 [Eleusine coracana subsp. coracana]